MKFWKSASGRRATEENDSDAQIQPHEASLIQSKAPTTASGSRRAGASQGPKLRYQQHSHPQRCLKLTAIMEALMQRRMFRRETKAITCQLQNRKVEKIKNTG